MGDAHLKESTITVGSLDSPDSKEERRASPLSPASNMLKKFKLRGILRECVAEFIGTMVLIMFGDGVVAQKVLSEDGAGSALGIHLCWGLAVLFGVMVSAGVSGAHLNPAVSFSLACFGRFRWSKLGPYIASQMLGAFVGAALVYSVYSDSFTNIDGGVRSVIGPTATAGVFCTYPAPHTSIISRIWNEVVGTALLMGGIFAIGDSRNVGLPSQAGPYTVAALVMAIGMSFGWQTGYAINPARDFGPRLFTAAAGWGSEVFTAYDFYFLVPLLAPMLGGPIGAGVYCVFVEHHHPHQD